MRESIRGLKKQPNFQNQLAEKSNFSAPEDSDPKHDEHHQYTNQKSTHEICTEQQYSLNQNERHSQNINTDKKQNIESDHSFDQASPLIKQQKNPNSAVNIYTVIFYLGILVYAFYFSLLLMPSIMELGIISKVTMVVLSILFYMNLLLIVVSYEKARRLSPGYPIKLQEIYKVQKLQQALNLQQVMQLRNRTIQLLVKKSELKQNYKKNPTLPNQQILKAFQFSFFAQQRKFCQKCINLKQVRVRHCSECNRCIERMDHHCLWLNNCVGKRNHKFFMLLLLFLITLLTFFFVIGALDLLIKRGELADWIGQIHGGLQRVFHLVLMLLAGLLWFYYIFVFFQQLYLILNNLTFVESLSKVLSQKKPWKHQSCYLNFSQVFGPGCWVCPTQVKQTAQLIIKDNKKKSPSVELVQQVFTNGPPENFNTQNHLKHQKNQI